MARTDARQRANAAGATWGRLLRAILGVALAGAIGLLTAPPAASHDRLVESTPTEDAVLTALPERVELTFSSDVVPIAPVLVVQDAAGSAIQDAAPTASGRVLHTPLPADLKPGGYVVRWRVVAQDGHPVEGSFTFRLESASGTIPGTATAPGTATPDDHGGQDDGDGREGRSPQRDAARHTGGGCGSVSRAGGSAGRRRGIGAR